MTNSFPGVGFTDYGKSFNYFQKSVVSNTAYGGQSVDGYQPSQLITFTTQFVIMNNETTGQVVEYSFNGINTHGELDGATGSPYKTINMPNRVVSKIFFRLKSGSAGPATISVQAWG